MEPYAIVVIDVWDTNNLANKNLLSMYEQMTQRICLMIKDQPNTHINRVLVTNYNAETHSIHPNLHAAIYDNKNKEYHKNCLFTSNRNKAIAWLADNNIKKLYYTGSSMPGCVSDRPLGLKNMPDSFEKFIVMDAISLVTSYELSDWSVMHDMYKSTIQLANQSSWNITWSNQLCE